MRRAPLSIAFMIVAVGWETTAERAPAQLPPPPPAISQLDSSDAEQRASAARDLGALGPAAAPAVPALTARLADEAPQVRAYACYALGMIGPAAAPVFPKLVERVADADPQVRREAVKALRRLKVDRALLIPALIRVLESSSSEEVIPAMQAIAEIGKEAVPALVEALKHEEARYWACQILSEIGPDASDAAAAVAEVLKDPRVEVRREAVLCLGQFGAAAKPFASNVLILADDPDAGTRAAAVWAAVMIEAPADAVRPKLTKLSTDSYPLVKVVAAWAAAKLDPSDAAARRAAVDTAVAALKDQHAPVRGAAARSLVDLKITHDTDPEAVEALVHALADDDEAVAPIVTQALIAGGEASVPKLINGLARPEVRGYACMVLIQLGPKGKGAKEALAPLTKEADVHLRAAAVAALAAVAGDDPAVVASTAAALDDPQGEVRYAAADSLGRLGPAAKSAEPALRKHADDQDPAVREAVGTALKAINP
jgi:HEAT repeat protein